MANKILINVQNGIEEPAFINNIEGFVLKAMDKLNFDNEEVSILFCNNKYIRLLNYDFREIDSATDVLSFENDYVYEEEGVEWKMVGDIAISVEMIGENADYFKTTPNAELKRLLVHGLLHLNGMDHGEEHIEAGVEPECEMLVLQEKLLKELESEVVIK